MHFNVSRSWTRAVVFAVALGAQACSISPFHRPGYAARNTIMPQAGVVTIQNQAGYMSYHAGTLLDTKAYTYVREARGEACQRGIGLPFGLFRNFFGGGRYDPWFTFDMRWGEGTLHKAMQQATSSMRSDEALVDIAIDQHQTSVLSVLYRETCLVVQGRIMAPPSPKADAVGGVIVPTATIPPAPVSREDT